VQWDPPEPHGQIVGRTDMTKPEDACCYLCESTYKEELLDKRLAQMKTTIHACERYDLAI